MYFCLYCVLEHVSCDAVCVAVCFFFFKQKTAYEMRISDWSSDVCSSDLPIRFNEPSSRKNRVLPVRLSASFRASGRLPAASSSFTQAECMKGDRKSVV